jgi:hypothetical protein
MVKIANGNDHQRLCQQEERPAVSGIVVRGRDDYEGEHERKSVISLYVQEIDSRYRHLPWQHRPVIVVQSVGVVGVRVVGPDEFIQELAAKLVEQEFPVHAMTRFDWEMEVGRRDSYGRLRTEEPSTARYRHLGDPPPDLPPRPSEADPPGG